MGNQLSVNARVEELFDKIDKLQQDMNYLKEKVRIGFDNQQDKANKIESDIFKIRVDLKHLSPRAPLPLPAKSKAHSPPFKPSLNPKRKSRSATNLFYHDESDYVMPTTRHRDEEEEDYIYSDIRFRNNPFL